MVKPASTFCQSKVPTVAVLVYLVGLALARSSLAQAAISEELRSVPVARLSPASMDFGIQAIEARSPQRTITLTNSGTAPLVISDFAIAGRDKDDFNLNQNCPGTLAAGKNCALNLTFSPVAPGPRMSSIVITTNGKASPQNVALVGIGTTLSPSDTSLSFGDQNVGSGSPAKALIITNKGSGALHLARISILGPDASDFSLTSTCGSVLAARAQCTVSVIFNPTAKGGRTASLQFSDEDGGSLQDVRITATGTGPGQYMALSADKTHLVNTITNKPVYVNGEDAFDLAVQLSSSSDVDTYLSDRASRGFNLLWVAMVDNAYHDFVGNQNNALGQNPWGGNADFTNEDPDYWAHVDYIIQRAAAYGITILAGPMFAGSYRGCAESGGYCPDIKSASDAVMTDYGVFLGNRYKSYPNIIWLIGGDANISREGSALYNKLNDLALGIKSADSNHLMAVEAGNDTTGGEPSWRYFGGASWLDLNSIYMTCSCRDFGTHMGQVLSQSSSGYSEGHAPVFVMEDWYEGEHSSTPLGLRQEAYQAILNGAYIGGLFGNNAIFTFSSPCCDTMGQTWQSELNSPGSLGREYLGRLMRSREHWKMVPDLNHAVVTEGYGTGSTLTTTSRTSDGQTIIAYIPNGNLTTLTVDMGKITSVSRQAKSWWFNPRDGTTMLIGTYANMGSHNFTPPDSHDWVLVIDDASANLAAPGSADL